MSNAQQGWTTSEDVDFDSASKEAPPPLPVGLYKFEVTKTEPQATQKEGHPAAQVELRAVEAKDPTTDLSKYNGRLPYERIVFTKDAAWKVKQLADAAGVPAPKSNGFEPVCEFLDAILGQQVWAQTKLRPSKNNGKVYAEVDKYLTEAEVGGETQPAAGGRRKRR